MEEITQLLWKASEHRQICRVVLTGEPFPRLVHPYGICQTSNNKISLVCWQEAGFTKAGGRPGYRNLILQHCESVEITDKHFVRREDFNLADGQYKDWVYHI